MTYQLTCRYCGQELIRERKSRSDRSKFGPVCDRHECRSELARRVFHSREAEAQRAAVMAERRAKAAARFLFGICRSCQHIRARADMQDDRCKFCPGSVPRLGAQPLPAGFSVTRYPEPPEDRVEQVLREIGARG